MLQWHDCNYRNRETRKLKIFNRSPCNSHRLSLMHRLGHAQMGKHWCSSTQQAKKLWCISMNIHSHTLHNNLPVGMSRQHQQIQEDTTVHCCWVCQLGLLVLVAFLTPK